MKLILFIDGNDNVLERKIVSPGGVKRTITNFCKRWDCELDKWLRENMAILRDNLGRIVFVEVTTYSKRYHG